MRVEVSPRASTTTSCGAARGRAQRVASTWCWPAASEIVRRGRHVQGAARRRPARARRRPGRRGAGGRAGRRSCSDEPLRAGDTVLMDARSGLLLEKLPRPEVEELVLEEVPDISYDDVGGLDEQIEQITDAVELPFLHQDLFAEYELPAPKGILLYGPPGCGKTLIAKAVANSLAKKVAEVTGDARPAATSSTSRAPSCSTSTSARPSARSAWCSSGPGRRRGGLRPSSCSSTRWSRCSAPAAPASRSDMESTIVPQLLAEIDGVETLQERDRDRRLQPRGPDRPRHPAPGPPRREDQDRAPRRGGGGADLLPLPHHRPPARRRRGRVARRRRPRQGRAGDDRAHRRGDVPRPTRPTSSSRSRTRTATRRSCTSRTSRRAP